MERSGLYNNVTHFFILSLISISGIPVCRKVNILCVDFAYWYAVNARWYSITMYIVSRCI